MLHCFSINKLKEAEKCCEIIYTIEHFKDKFINYLCRIGWYKANKNYFTCTKYGNLIQNIFYTSIICMYSIYNSTYSQGDSGSCALHPPTAVLV